MMDILHVKTLTGSSIYSSWPCDTTWYEKTWSTSWFAVRQHQSITWTSWMRSSDFHVWLTSEETLDISYQNMNEIMMLIIAVIYPKFQWVYKAKSMFGLIMLFHPIISDHFVNAPSQWEMVLYCNAMSHWLGTYTEWSLYDTQIHTYTHAHIY